MTNPIGAVATIRWADSNEISENYFFSFEKFPEDADENYVLPLAKIADNQVFLYCDSAEEFLGWTTNHGAGDFDILSFVLVTAK
jgi:hypothetical protein